MDVDDLKIVATVAKHGSMNRAAGELHMVQSAVTSRIRLLEEELGVRLFIRHSRGVRLSDAGTRLLSYSDRIHSLLSEAIAATKEDGIPKGNLRIGSTEPTVSMRLPQIVAEYAAHFPAVALTISTGNSVELIEQVAEQSLDGAFVTGPVSNPDLIQETIFQEELVLVSPPSIQAIDQLVSSKDMKAILLDRGCSYRERLCEVLNGRGISHQILSVSSFDAIRMCVEAGVGVTVLPKEFLATVWRDETVVIHELPEFAAPFEIVFIRRSESERLSALNAFLAKTRDVSRAGTSAQGHELSHPSIAPL